MVDCGMEVWHGLHGSQASAESRDSTEMADVKMIPPYAAPLFLEPLSKPSNKDKGTPPPIFPTIYRPG